MTTASRPANDFTDLVALAAGRATKHHVRVHGANCDRSVLVLARDNLTLELQLQGPLTWSRLDEDERVKVVDGMLQSAARILGEQRNLPARFAQAVPRLRPILLPHYLARLGAGVVLRGTPYHFAVAWRDPDGFNIRVLPSMLDRWGVTPEQAMLAARERMKRCELDVDVNPHNPVGWRWHYQGPYAPAVLLDIPHWIVGIPEHGVVARVLGEEDVVLQVAGPDRMQVLFDLFRVSADEKPTPSVPVWYFPDGTFESPAGKVKTDEGDVYLPGPRGIALVTGRPSDPGPTFR